MPKTATIIERIENLEFQAALPVAAFWARALGFRQNYYRNVWKIAPLRGDSLLTFRQRQNDATLRLR